MSPEPDGVVGEGHRTASGEVSRVHDSVACPCGINFWKDEERAE